jgi:hypothetical protein
MTRSCKCFPHNKIKCKSHIQTNVRENRKAQEWTIQRNWQHWVHIQDTERRQTKQKNTAHNTKKDEQHEPNQKLGEQHYIHDNMFTYLN